MVKGLAFTPEYASPELIENHKYSEYADAWAIGCLIFEMYTKGEFLFGSRKNKSLEEIKCDIINKNYNEKIYAIEPPIRELIFFCTDSIQNRFKLSDISQYLFNEI